MATSLIWWEAMAAKFPAANAPAALFTAGANFNWMGLSFAGNAGAADEYCDFIGVVPDSYTGAGNVTARIYWVPAAASPAGENCSWDVSILGRVDDEIFDAAFTDTATFNDVVTAAADLQVAPVALAAPTLQPGDIILLRVNRDHDEADGGTALDEDAVLIGIQLVED